MPNELVMTPKIPYSEKINNKLLDTQKKQRTDYMTVNQVQYEQKGVNTSPYKAQTGVLYQEIERIQQEKNSLEKEQECLQNKFQKLMQELDSKSNNENKITQQLNENQQRAQQLQTKNEVLIDQITHKDVIIKEQLKNLDETRQMLLKMEEMRKQLHDQLQILRGNLRIFCRIKPVRDQTDSDQLILVIPQLLPMNQKCQTLDLQEHGKTVSFFFDQVFPMDCTQSEIFLEILPFIQSAIDGQQCCIIAYGQTGTGKTYTMQGPDGMELYQEQGEGFEKYAGVLPRTIQFMFEEKKRLEKQSKLISV